MPVRGRPVQGRQLALRLGEQVLGRRQLGPLLLQLCKVEIIAVRWMRVWRLGFRHIRQYEGRVSHLQARFDLIFALQVMATLDLGAKPCPEPGFPLELYPVLRGKRARQGWV